MHKSSENGHFQIVSGILPAMTLRSNHFFESFQVGKKPNWSGDFRPAEVLKEEQKQLDSRLNYFLN